MKMNFENWYNKILVESETVVKAEVATATADHSIASNTASREDIISDVDSIMTQLDQLSAQVKEDFNIEILDESLIMEGAWDDTKSSFGELFSDPVFQLVGLGLAGILGTLGLGVKAIKDTKRNGAIGKMVMGDYAKLKQLKLQAVKLEAIQHQLEEKKEEIEAEGGRKKSQFESVEVISEAEPKAKAPLNNVQQIAAKKAEKEKAAKMQAAQAKKDAADAKKAQASQKNEPTDKTTSDDENAAKEKMREKIEAQISAIAKKRDTLDNSINTFEQALDAKYDPEKITGFGSKKVSTLIASAKDGIAQEVAEAKLKFFGETLSDEAKKELQDSLAAINKRSAERKAEIDREAKENAEKAKEAAEKDEEVKQALADMKNKKENPSAETDEPQTSDSPETKDKSSGPSDAEKAAKTQQDKQTKDAADAEKYKTQRAEADKKKQDKEKANQSATDKDAKKNTKDGMIDRYMQLLKKADKDGDEKKYREIKDKIAALQKTESWQLEGTELGRLFEMELLKMEAEFKLFESKNTVTSVADKFRILLG